MKSASKRPFQFLMMTPEKIQKSLTNGIENITWVGVDLNGTTIHMKVVEKMSPKKKNMLVRAYCRQKESNHYENVCGKRGAAWPPYTIMLKKGQMLVSGLIGSEDHQQKVGAKAENLW
jgi:similar to stage IV sporulation protein